MRFVQFKTKVARLSRAAILGFSSLSVSVVVSAGTANTYEATVSRTAGGIPHIVADDFASLGFGTGYAAAEDNVCFLAKNFLKLDAKLARHFGPQDGNLQSDLFYQLLNDSGRYDEEVAPEFKAIFQGYAAGYNRYLRDTGIKNINDRRCKGADWVRPVTASEIKRIHLTPFFLPNFKDMLMAAKPPGGAEEVAVESDQMLIELASAAGNPFDKGSNGVAIGREGTANGRGLLYANPHLVWDENWRFYPMHQVIPGVLNLLGANAIDRASVGFGTNEHVAWTNTVSTATRYSFYQLVLQPGEPTTYLVDGKARKMQSHPVEVEVKMPDGSLEKRSHTFYSTDFGYLVGRFPWNDKVAFALRIADEGARGTQGGLLDAYRARNVRELKAAQDRYQFSPVNLIAADKNGEVLYADVGPVANISDAQLKTCSVFYGKALDGSRSECQWQNDAEAAAPGLLGASKQPHLFRHDYVTNSNDSYWLANPAQPLSGYHKSIGSVATERTLRTRSGLKMVQARLQGAEGENRFDLATLRDTLLSNQNMAGQLLRDDLVVLCESSPMVTVYGTEVDLSVACPVLAAWDLSDNLDSRGAHLFREFIWEALNDVGKVDERKPYRWLPPQFNYAVPFDPAQPLDTPRGLNTEDNPEVLQALAKAVKKLQDAGVALDAPLGDLQVVAKNGELIPLHGGPETVGVFNKLESRFQGAKAYSGVTGSSVSWLMATEFTEQGPVAQGLLAYSLSTNPDSPHFVDMTRNYSSKQFVDLPFTLAQVEAAAQSRKQLTEGAADCQHDGWKAFLQPSFAGEAECIQYFDEHRVARLTDYVAPATK